MEWETECAYCGELIIWSQKHQEESGSPEPICDRCKVVSFDG